MRRTPEAPSLAWVTPNPQSPVGFLLRPLCSRSKRIDVFAGKESQRRRGNIRHGISSEKHLRWTSCVHCLFNERGRLRGAKPAVLPLPKGPPERHDGESRQRVDGPAPNVGAPALLMGVGLVVGWRIVRGRARLTDSDESGANGEGLDP